MRSWIFTAFLLSGCSYNAVMQSPQPDHNDLPLQTEIKITDFIPSGGRKTGTAKYWEKPCNIQISKPRHPEDNYAFCVIGHEVWHCLTGDFHHDIKAYCSE